MRESCQTIDAGLFHFKSLHSQPRIVVLNPPHWWVKTRVVWQDGQAQTYRAEDFVMASDWRKAFDGRMATLSIDKLDIKRALYRKLSTGGVKTIGDLVSLSDNEIRLMVSSDRNALLRLACALEELAYDFKYHDAGNVGPGFLATMNTENYAEYVYLLEWNGYHKIGYSTDVERRVRQMTTLPTVINILHRIEVKKGRGYSIERSLHHKFAGCRVQGYCLNEWYVLPDEDVRWFCSLKDGELDECKQVGDS